MRETTLAYNSQPAYAINVKILVTVNVFTTALTDHFYSKNESFPDKINKREARKILNNRLVFYGRDGDYSNGYFEGSSDEGEKYNTIYKDALIWVENNYPYLKTNSSN